MIEEIKLESLTRYDPEIDPYSSACSPCATMDECKYGDWVRYDDVVKLLEDKDG